MENKEHDNRQAHLRSTDGGAELYVGGLYRDLALSRARELRETLPLASSDRADRAHFAEGSEALIEAAAYLNAAADFVGCRGSRALRLLAVADAVLGEAAAFAHTADIFAAGARGTARR